MKIKILNKSGIIILLIMFTAGLKTNAQEKHPKNYFYGKLGYAGLAYTHNINYERTIYTMKNNNISLNGRLGYGKRKEILDYSKEELTLTGILEVGKLSKLQAIGEVGATVDISNNNEILPLLGAGIRTGFGSDFFYLMGGINTREYLNLGLGIKF